MDKPTKADLLYAEQMAARATKVPWPYTPSAASVRHIRQLLAAGAKPSDDTPAWRVLLTRPDGRWVSVLRPAYELAQQPEAEAPQQMDKAA